MPIVVVGVTTYQGDGNAVYRAKWHRAESWRIMSQAKCLLLRSPKRQAKPISDGMRLKQTTDAVECHQIRSLKVC